MVRKINAAGIGLIEHFESCRLEAYQDRNGIWTIGWGHTGPDVHAGLVWTQTQADATFQLDLQDACQVVVSNVNNCTLTDNQFAALVSFVFNVGPGSPSKGKPGFVRLANGKPSTMLRALNRGDYKAAALEFPRWNRDSHGPCAGLTARRAAEQALFRS